VLRQHRAIQAIEANPLQLWKLLTGYASGGVCEIHQGVTLVSVPIAHPLFNSAPMAEIEPGSEEAAIDAAKGFFRERGMPWTWIVGPATRPKGLEQALLATGFQHSHDTPGMALDLRSYKATRSTAEEISGNLEPWLRVVLQTFNMPDEAGQPFRQLFGSNPGDARFRYFLAREDGRPVATAMNYYGAGVAGIFCVATLPECQRKGHGANVMAACLEAAVEDGYDVAVLHSSRAGVRLYESLGFREYCKLAYYEPPAP
jgi:ribosomal protein S18 acetylase RimI-like enzyme